MRHFCPVSVLPAVGNCQLTLYLDKQGDAPAGKRAQCCCERYQQNDIFCHQRDRPLKIYMSLFTCALHFEFFLHFTLPSSGLFLWDYLHLCGWIRTFCPWGSVVLNERAVWRQCKVAKIMKYLLWVGGCAGGKKTCFCWFRLQQHMICFLPAHHIASLTEGEQTAIYCR